MSGAAACAGAGLGCWLALATHRWGVLSSWLASAVPGLSAGALRAAVSSALVLSLCAGLLRCYGPALVRVSRARTTSAIKAISPPAADLRRTQSRNRLASGSLMLPRVTGPGGKRVLTSTEREIAHVFGLAQRKLQHMAKFGGMIYGRQFTSVAEAFHKADRTGSGTLERKEFYYFLGRHGINAGVDFSDEVLLEGVWEDIDRDGNGEITLEEFMERLQWNTRERVEEGTPAPPSGRGKPGLSPGLTPDKRQLGRSSSERAENMGRWLQQTWSKHSDDTSGTESGLSLELESGSVFLRSGAIRSSYGESAVKTGDRAVHACSCVCLPCMLLCLGGAWHAWRKDRIHEREPVLAWHAGRSP
eukprot:COSAG01_NODE_395_length_17610_cov_20.238764_2_plen_360_part_00